MTLLKKSRYWFGMMDKEPRIHGHEVIMAKGDWLKARQGNREFFVEDLGGDWRLRPACIRDGHTFVGGGPAKIIPKHL